MHIKVRGFTLIELLVVIAIIAILTSIVVGSLSNAKKSTRDSRRIADIKTIQLALALYYSDHNYYPVNIYASSSGFPAPSSRNGLAGAYLAIVPTDPNKSGVCTLGIEDPCYDYLPLTTASAQTCYSSNSIPPSRYKIGTVFENLSASELARDNDVPSQNSGVLAGWHQCNGTDDFVGTSPGAASGCTATAGTAQPGGTEACYDLLP